MGAWNHTSPWEQWDQEHIHQGLLGSQKAATNTLHHISVLAGVQRAPLRKEKLTRHSVGLLLGSMEFTMLAKAFVPQHSTSPEGDGAH